MAFIPSITIRKRGKKWQLDYYDEGGKRCRPTVETERQAKDLKDRLILKFLGVSEGPDKKSDVSSEIGEQSDISLAEAIRKYDEIVGVNHTLACRRNERGYFDSLYDYLFEVEKIDLLKDVKLIHLENFRSKLSTVSKLKASSINRRFVAYAAFFNKCVNWGLIAKSPSERLEKLPEEINERRVWTPAQVKLIMDRIREMKEDPQRDQRKSAPKCPIVCHANHAELLFVLVDTGSRPNEGCSLSFGPAVDFDNGLLSFTSRKGGRTKLRRVPMSEETKRILLNLYNEARREFRAKDGDPVFINSKKHRLTPNAFAKAVRAARESLISEGHDIPEDLVPYGLRHTFGSDLEAQGVSLRKIGVLMGHSRTTTTERYTRVREDQLREVVSQASKSRVQLFEPLKSVPDNTVH